VSRERRRKKRRETHLLSRIDEFSDLKHRSPHRSLTSRNRRCPRAVVEELVRDDRASQTEKTKTNASDEEDASRRFVEDGEVRDGVAGRTGGDGLGAGSDLRNGGGNFARVGGRGQSRRRGEADLLEDRDVLARSPYSVDGNVKLQLAGEQFGELGEAESVL
jgi:hypothetical protein